MFVTVYQCESLHKAHYGNVPFELPGGWAWCRLGDVCEIARGGSPRPIQKFITQDSNGINWIKIGDTVHGGKYITQTQEKIKPEGQTHSRYVYAGDFLLTNSMSFGRPYILKINGCIHDGWLVIGDVKNVFISDFLYYLLRSEWAFQSLSKVAYGSTVRNLKSDTVKTFYVPLPPIEEQQRISIAIESVFSVIDEIERNKADLQAAVATAKRKILSLAISGKLVPQDPDDEPASALLERIRAESEALGKVGKSIRGKGGPVIPRGDDKPHYKNVPFEVPAGWAWCRLGDVCEIARGGSPRPIQKFITQDSNGINWIKIGDTIHGGKYITQTQEKIRPEGKTHSRYVYSGDFLLTNSMSFGRPYILKINGCIHDGWLVIGGVKNVFVSDFLYYLLSSEWVFQSLSKVAYGSTVKNLKSDTVKAFYVPLPPLAEQHRIVIAIEGAFKQLDDITAMLLR